MGLVRADRTGDHAGGMRPGCAVPCVRYVFEHHRRHHPRRRRVHGTMSEPGYTPPDITLVGEEHVRRYVETDGAVGHEWNGVHTLVLTTTGRPSRPQRPSAMIYGQ